MNDRLFAHYRREESGNCIPQTLKDHCQHTAAYAASALQETGLHDTGYYCGLLHDMGKAKDEYQEYLRKAVFGKNAVRGSVQHSFAAVRYVLSKHHRNNQGEPGDTLIESCIIPELIAYAMGAHHGLFDLVDHSHKSGFARRITDETIGYTECIHNCFNSLFDESEIEDKYRKSAAELKRVIDKIRELAYAPIDGPEGASHEQHMDTDYRFYLSLLARLILSGVIEGDHRDTSEFMCGTEFSDTQMNDMNVVWSSCITNLEKNLLSFSEESQINRARKKIADLCKDFAQNEEGIYRLNVPTGAGKTLSSFRFALHHARRRNKKRIIFVTPLISILEQNAAVIREIVGNDELILEHHSNIVQELKCNSETERECENENDRKMDFLIDSWQAPIIITTLVQFLNTLYSGRTSSIRRFHALCNSIIVFDEVQTVPVEKLTLFNLAVSFLKEICNSTIIMCSATQPALEEAQHPICQIGYGTEGRSFRKQIRDIVPFEESLWSVFKRTEIADDKAEESEGIHNKAIDMLRTVDSVLIICNTRKEASDLFELFDQNLYKCFHLSAGMCMDHRRRTLMSLYQALDERKEKVICVATQVIEAGVDISFGGVIRYCAGMDNIVQAAGRCNRNGENKKPGPVKIVRVLGENLRQLKYIERGKNATIDLLQMFRNNPERFKNDLTSNEAIQYYYRSLYSDMSENGQDYCFQVSGEGIHSMYELLSDNYRYASVDQLEKLEYPYFMTQAFLEAGKHFQAIDAVTTEIIVPYGRGKVIISDLLSEQGQNNYAFMRQLVMEAKAYTISVYEGQMKQLEKQGAITYLFDGRILVLNDGFYDESTGVVLKKRKMSYLEVSL